MKLLIVDDNKNNRMVLTLLLEDYADDNGGVEFSIDEAIDGLEAVSMSKAKQYDMILMDIMMPNMDGIEATKLIRQNDKKVMIIAVSAVDDQERQKEILSCGAEDYISKPVNADIFNARISNYIHLINSRTKKIENEFGVNLFTKEIYKRYTKFQLSSEDALSELWECFLLEGDEDYEGLSDTIRMIFSLGEVQLRLGIEASLFVESSYEYQYFTVTDIQDVPAQVIRLLLKKNEVTSEYKLGENKLSFKLEKILEEVVVVETPVEVKPLEKVVDEQTVTEEITPTYTSSSDLVIFDYIDPDDMADLEEFVGKLNSLMLIVGSGDITQDEVIEMYTYIDRLGSILSSYSEVYAIANALSSLANDMATYTDTFIENSEALGPMCSAFSRDLTNWMEQSFHTGAPSVDFMNDTIVVNCQTIGSMLKMDEEVTDSDEEFDDIFDF